MFTPSMPLPENWVVTLKAEWIHNVIYESYREVQGSNNRIVIKTTEPLNVATAEHECYDRDEGKAVYGNWTNGVSPNMYIFTPNSNEVLIPEGWRVSLWNDPKIN